MKSITIPIFPEFDDSASLALLSGLMDSLIIYPIDQQPWQKFLTSARAKFAIAHTGKHLVLKYYLDEKEITAVVRETNTDVSNDNCVELFIAFDHGGYYNLEFNCLGSAKVGYGQERNGRTLLPVKLIEKIKVYTNIKSETDEDRRLSWQIVLMIPREIFAYTTIDSFDGLKCRANFYKCGDDLKEPHFLTWNLIETPEPDFHQPDYFGNIDFEPQVVYTNNY